MMLTARQFLMLFPMQVSRFNVDRLACVQALDITLQAADIPMCATDAYPCTSMLPMHNHVHLYQGIPMYTYAAHACPCIPMHITNEEIAAIAVCLSSNKAKTIAAKTVNDLKWAIVMASVEGKLQASRQFLKRDVQQ